MPQIFISPEFLPVAPVRSIGNPVVSFFRALIRPSLQAQWLDAQDLPLEERFRLPTPGVSPVEYSDGEGNFAVADVPEGLVLDAEVPINAATLKVTLGGNTVSNISLMALGRSHAPRRGVERLFPPEGGGFRIDVISERFTSADEFFDLAKDLYDHWTTAQFPFTEQGIKDVFCIRALYWPSDLSEGNFHTPDSAIKDRILQGNGGLVRAYQEAHGEPSDFALVLINSRERAGAGGAAFKREWRPSWMTITARPPEDWRSLALHEFGHSLGLADEYDTPYTLPVTHFEPNVSNQGGCANAPKPWSQMCAGVQPPYQRLFNDLRPVTSIEGARYSPRGWYRPFANCLMRTSTAKFCPVCVEYVGLRLLGRVPPSLPLQ